MLKILSLLYMSQKYPDMLNNNTITVMQDMALKFDENLNF